MTRIGMVLSKEWYHTIGNKYHANDFCVGNGFGAQDSNTQAIYACPNYITSNGNPVVRTADAVDLYPATQIHEVRAYCMFDKVIAFNETSGSIRSEYERWYVFKLFCVY